MSLTATLIAFASGLAAKVRLPKDPLAPEVMRLLVENQEAAGRIAQLERLIDTLDRELATERNLKAHWREEARYLAVQARERRHEINGRGAMMAAQMAQLAMQAQLANNDLQALGGLGQNMAAVQDGRYLSQQGGFQQLGNVAQNLLGAQNLDNARWREWVCTCIPDRASALRRP
jgi:hypothetical protein